MREVEGGLDAKATIADACAAAELICASRHAFRQFFDNILAERKLAESMSPLQATFISAFHLMSADGPDRTHQDHDEIALALLALGSRGAIAKVMASAIAAGLTDETGIGPVQVHKARDVRWRSLCKKLGITTDDGSETFSVRRRSAAERIIDWSSTWVDPMALYPALLLACKRICRVVALDEDGRRILGTGVLIGPSMVLTNWHVVKDVESPLDDHLSLTVQFDLTRSGQAESRSAALRVKRDWKVADCDIGALEPADIIWDNPKTGLREPWWTNAEVLKSWATAVGDKLDFAVIEVDGTPGDERGWYDLADVARATGGGACFVFHHPANQPLTLTAGSIPMVAGRPPVRIFHKANTIGGSSGGLIVNDRGVPIALHHAGCYSYGTLYPDDDLRSGINVAIPLTAIADRLGPELLEHIRTSRARRLPRGRKR